MSTRIPAEQIEQAEQVVCVYRSTHPDVLTAVDRCRVDERAWRARADQLLAELGMAGRDWCITTAFNSRSLLGVYATSADERPPRGWRTTTRKGRTVLVPSRGNMRGKRAAAALAACQPPDEPASRMPGMPGDWIDKGRVHSPGLYQVGGAVWMTWGCTLPERLPGSPLPHLAHPDGVVELALWGRATVADFSAAMAHHHTVTGGTGE